MIIIRQDVFTCNYTIMKKIISIIFLSLFTIFLISPLSSIVFAWDDIGIHFWNGCLTGMWSQCFHYEKIMWFDKDQPDYTATSIAQDVIFAATYILWTVLTIVMIACWLWYIFEARSSSSNTSKYKTWLINAGIWALLVRWAYAIVRLVQYISAWGAS